MQFSSSGFQPKETIDHVSSRFRWKIENFSRLNTQGHFSNTFSFGSHDWRVLIYPKGNNGNHLSIYLEAAEFVNSPSLGFSSFSSINMASGGFGFGSVNRSSWGFSFGSNDQIYAEFSLAIVNQIHNNYTVRKEIKQQFTRKENSWGFSKFILLSELNDPPKGYIVNDTCIVEVEVAVRGGMEYSTYDSKKALSDKSTQTEPQVGVPTEVVAPITEMDPAAVSMLQPETQTELEGKRNDTVGVTKAHIEVQLEDQVPMSENEVTVSMEATQSGKITLFPDFLGAGQLFEEGRHRLSILDEKFEEIGGFNVLKTQASLYKQIWLKYGHIASSEVLTDSYPSQVSVVTDIMTCVMFMHHHCFAEMSSAMIDSWEKKIKMAEKLEFNIKWLREHFEDIKKDFNREQKLKTALLEQDQAKARLIATEEQFILAKDELKKAQVKVSALKTRISPIRSGRQMYLEEGSRSVLDGLF